MPHDTIELARGEIAAGAVLTIHLIRPRPDLEDNLAKSPAARAVPAELVAFRWPDRDTEIPARRLPAAASAIVAVLAEARVQLAAIRAAEL